MMLVRRGEVAHAEVDARLPRPLFPSFAHKHSMLVAAIFGTAATVDLNLHHGSISDLVDEHKQFCARGVAAHEEAFLGGGVVVDETSFASCGETWPARGGSTPSHGFMVPPMRTGGGH